MSATAKVEHLPAAQPANTLTPPALVALAVEKGANVDQLERLMALQERWEGNEAKKVYTTAMAQFKADPPRIVKNKGVNIPGGAAFKHATLAEVCDGVVAALSKHGFSHRWEVEQKERLITVTCIITHERGHSEKTTLTAAPDDSGKKNAIQQVASTVTYLERYTLLAATGLAAKDMDDDGRWAGSSNGKSMDENALADYLAAIDAADTEEALRKVFGPAWKAAESANDRGAMRLLTQHKDSRKKGLAKS